MMANKLKCVISTLMHTIASALIFISQFVYIHVIFQMYRASYGHVEIGCAVHLVVHYTPLLDL